MAMQIPLISLLICIIDPVSVATMPDAFLCMYLGKLCIAMPGFLVGDGEQVQQQQYNVVLSSVSVFAIYATNLLGKLAQSNLPATSTTSSSTVGRGAGGWAAF